MEAPQLKEAAPVAELPAPPKKKSPTRAFLILGIVAGVVVGGVGIHALLTGDEETTDDAQIEADVVGLSARVPGVVKQVLVKDDQLVKKGDLVLVLDDADFAAHVAQAEAGLQTAKAQADAADAQVDIVQAAAKGGLSSAKAMVSGSSIGVSSADAQIEAAKAGLERAKTEAQRAQLEFDRAKELRGANAIPQQAFDNARLANEAAQAALSGAKAQLDAAQQGKTAALSRVEEARGRLGEATPIDARIAAAKAQAAVAHAGVLAASAALDLAKLQESYTKVYAPADGMVSRVTAREGALIQPGQPVGELVPNETYVVANFKETQVGRMEKADSAEVTIDAFPGRTFRGEVESLSGGTGSRFSLLPPDNASGNFVKVVQRVPVRIVWRNPPGVPLRAGESAEVTVHFR